MHNLNTTGWNQFPFSVDGVDYISKVSNDSPFMKRISKLPNGMFEEMNVSAIRELVGTGLTRDELLTKLDLVNEGASHAVIELA